MPITGTTVVRRQLGRRLRRLRDAAGKSEGDVDEAGLMSRSKLWRIETGRVIATVGDVRGLCWLYGVDGRATDALARLALASREPGFWETEHDIGPDARTLFTDLESVADEVRIYQPEFVPALLQTHEPRQRLIAIFGASAFAGPACDPAATKASLCELNRREHLDIRILPWEAHVPPTMRTGPFAIMDFPTPDDPAVVCVETLTGTHYLEKPAELAAYRRAFTQIYRRTHPVEDLVIPASRAPERFRASGSGTR